MYITCLDLEGVLVPEIWIAFAEEINAFSNNIILNYRFIFFKSTLRNVGCRTESLVLY